MTTKPSPIPKKSNGIVAIVVGVALIVLATLLLPLGRTPGPVFHLSSFVAFLFYIVGAILLRRRREISPTNLLLFVSACAIGLFIAEIALAVAGVPPLKRFVWRPPDLVPWWGPTANGQVRFIPDKYSGPWTINPQGFPDSDDFDVPVSARRRVILLGDSFAYGASASSFSKSFAEILDAAPDTMVWNLGIPGTGHQEQLELLAGAPYEAQLIVATLYRNDFADNLLPPWRFYVFADGHWVDRYESVFGGFRALTPTQAYRRAFGVQTLRDMPKVSRTASAIANLVRKLAREPVGDLTHASPDYERTKLLIHSLQAQARTRNATFVLLLIPDRADTVLISQPYQESRKICDELGLTCIDALVDLKEIDYVPAPDTHWNDSGHAKIAARVLLELDRLVSANPALTGNDAIDSIR